MKAEVAERVAELEERWGRITACRVMILAPSDHHRTGGLYEIHIHLSLPDGREVNVTRTPTADERHADVTFALNDAFKHARRQLQDRVRRVQGQTKHHEAAAIGKVVRIDPAGEFGFLEDRDAQKIYFHRNSVVDGGFARLRVGSQVAYTEEMGEKGAQASSVTLLGKHSLRSC